MKKIFIHNNNEKIYDWNIQLKLRMRHNDIQESKEIKEVKKKKILITLVHMKKCK